MTTLRTGDPAPDFALLEQHGETVKLADYRGRKLLVYFYPEADTPGCTTQSCDLRDHRQDLAAIGLDVVGISPDPPPKQLAFDEKYRLGFPLLADEDHAVAEAYGVWKEKNNYGIKALGIVRSTFLIDSSGVLRREWRKVKVAGHAAAVLDAAREL